MPKNMPENTNLLDFLNTIKYITTNTKKEINPCLSEIIVILKTFNFNTVTKRFDEVDEVIERIRNLKEQFENIKAILGNDSEIDGSRRLRINKTLDDTIYFLGLQKESNQFASDWDLIHEYYDIIISEFKSKLLEQVNKETSSLISESHVDTTPLVVVEQVNKETSSLTTEPHVDTTPLVVDAALLEQVNEETFSLKSESDVDTTPLVVDAANGNVLVEASPKTNWCCAKFRCTIS